MSAAVTCRRCGEEKPALSRAPVPGKIGEQIHASICVDCWAEWEKAEVMVINELRLNFMDPRSQQILAEQMREFLALPADAGTPGSGE